MFATQWQGAKCGSNATQGELLDEEEADEVFENMNLAEFKERYRRLIPYMTYYVANNYVNPQVLDAAQQQQQSPSYERENALAMSPLIRKPQRLVSVGRPTDPRRKPNRHRVSSAASGTLHKQEDKFVPSVQYDPKAIGGDSNYFTPVMYSPKLNYDTAEYSDDRVPSRHGEYDGHQRGPLVYAVASSPSPLSLHKDTRYYSKDRPPSRTYDPLYERTYSSPAQNSRPPSVHQDYLLDYGSRTTGNRSPAGGSDYAYPADDYDSVRYVNIEPPPQRTQHKPTRILAQSASGRPLLQSVSPIYSTRHTTLQDIMKSLQLTNRLPEMLNKDNVDSSINTLVEILRILNKAKETDYVRSPVPVAPNDQYQHVPSQDDFKPVYTRPTKVVTESRFQATPSPPVVTDEHTGRYRPEASYETSVNANRPPNADLEIVNNQKHHNTIEYYTPLIQDIDEAKVEPYRPVKIPVSVNDENEHTYEIPDDLAGEIHEKEKYPLPITTETPISKFQLPDGASTHTQLVPPTTLKYGATRGKPNVDYPAHAAIPETVFNCKEQRYKGFFGDPSTGCQVNDKSCQNCFCLYRKTLKIKPCLGE